MIYPWSSTPQLCLSFTADSIQSPMVVTLMQLFHSPALLARNSVLVVSRDRAVFRMTFKNGFGKCSSVICFISQWMKRSKHGLFVMMLIHRGTNYMPTPNDIYERKRSRAEWYPRKRSGWDQIISQLQHTHTVEINQWDRSKHMQLAKSAGNCLPYY